MRAFRNAPVLAEVARNVAEVAPDAYVFNYTNPAPIEALAMRAAAPQVKSLRAVLVHRAPGERRSGWPSRPASSPSEIAMPPVVAGINHCAVVPELRLRDGTDAMPLVREHADQPDRRRGRSRPTACCRTAGRTGSSSSRRCSGSRRVRRHRPGRRDALRHHHPRHGLREGARRASSRSWRRSGPRRAPPPVTLADLPDGRRGRGHRGDRHHRGDRREPATRRSS